MQLGCFRMRNYKRFFWPIMSVILLTFIILPCTLIHRKFVICNLTDSMPHGFYFIRSTSMIRRGDIVCFPIPAKARQTVVGRGWLRPDAFFLKKVVGLPGDHVRLDSDSFSVNYAEGARGYVLQKDGAGRPMPTFKYNGYLNQDAYFVAITDKIESFDSRYFGPIKKSEIIGVATPLWIF